MMTVAELIEDLNRMPQHHPILIDIGLRYVESVQSLKGRNDSRLGPHVVIYTESDPRNDPEPEVHYYEGDAP